MTTKTTAALITAAGAGAFLTDASNGLATDLIGGRSRTSATGVVAATPLSSGLWTFAAAAGGGSTASNIMTLGVG